MKIISERQALERLEKVKSEYRSIVQNEYEGKAKSCSACDTPGACCIDAHFVNVHITRLEAAAMRQNLQRLPETKQEEIYERIADTIEKYGLENSKDSFDKTFACPLYEKGSGCLIHSVKPVPCIQHACYERAEDLPPDELQTAAEQKIERLNERVYCRKAEWLPLPVWLKRT